MKRRSYRITYSAARAVAAAALTILAFAPGPVLAARDSGEERVEGRVEARIKDMHAKLNITQAQEKQWGKVAQVMRDNTSSVFATLYTSMSDGQKKEADYLFSRGSRKGLKGK